MRQENPEDVVVAKESGPELVNDPVSPYSAPIIPDQVPNDLDPPVWEVELDDTVSGGEYVGVYRFPNSPLQDLAVTVEYLDISTFIAFVNSVRLPPFVAIYPHSKCVNRLNR